MVGVVKYWLSEYRYYSPCKQPNSQSFDDLIIWPIVFRGVGALITKRYSLPKSWSEIPALLSVPGMCCVKNIDLLGAVSMYFIHQVKKWSTSKRSSAKVEIYDINLRKNGTTGEVKMRNVSLKLISANILLIAWKNIFFNFYLFTRPFLLFTFSCLFCPCCLFSGQGRTFTAAFPVRLRFSLPFHNCYSS